jgi:sphingolipid delta-4 desaturase
MAYQTATKKYQAAADNENYQPPPDYIRVPYLQPHWTRRKEILVAHPEIKDLMKPDPSIAFWVIATFVFMTALAWVLKDAPVFLVFAVAYGVGAFVCHAEWVLVHELGHDLAFRSSSLNTFFLLLANLNHIVPSSISFRYHHKMHHSHLNETYGDPDVPSPIEDTVFGHSMLGKAIWLSTFPLIQSVRTIRAPQPFEWATVFNFIANGVYAYLVFVYISPKALVFLFLSSMLSVGFLLHPLGARWIAEHWAVHPLQETYSYYGPINKFAFNIGYHNEHHDFVGIPWNKLPLLKEIAPEYYKPLYYHASYLKVIWVYLTNPNFTLKSRVVRSPKNRNE